MLASRSSAYVVRCFVGQRLVVLGAGRPQVLLDQVPPGPLLARLEVGLAGVHHRVQVAEGLRHGLDALPVRARDRVERPRRVVVAGLVELHELLGLLQQLRRLVLDVRRVVGRGLLDQGRVVGGRLSRLAVSRLGHRELAADALADHPRLAGGDVGAGRRREHELAVERGADVLDLADDAQAVVAEQVELGDVVAAVGHVERERAGGRLGGGQVARVVGRRDGDAARVARAVVGGARVGVLGAAGEGRDGHQGQHGEETGGAHQDPSVRRPESVGRPVAGRRDDVSRR